jgi:hypothetical protein
LSPYIFTNARVVFSDSRYDSDCRFSASLKFTSNIPSTLPIHVRRTPQNGAFAALAQCLVFPKFPSVEQQKYGRIDACW